MDIISFFLIPPLLVIATIFTNEFVNMAMKEIADRCSVMEREINGLRARIEELARTITEPRNIPVPQSQEQQEEQPEEVQPKKEPEKAQRSNDITYIGRNHSLSDIELACEIVHKHPEDIPLRERRFAGLVFTDLEDTYFFDQLMAQNQDLKDTIEASMRRFMSDNMKLEPAKRFYVPNSTFEKYMRTNEY